MPEPFWPGECHACATYRGAEHGPVGDPRRRSDAATDPDRAGGAEVAIVRRQVPDAGDVCRSVARRNPAALARARLPATGPRPPRRGRPRSSAPRRCRPERCRRPTRPAGRRPVHRSRGARFAFEHDDDVVETNTARLLARVAGERLTAKRVQAIADALVPTGEGWVWNQVLMDLGATVCRPAPRCAECPVAARCAWHRAGHPEPDPAVGSAGVSTTQPPYNGSARQARGHVLHVLAGGAAPAGDSRRRSSTASWPIASSYAITTRCACRSAH